MLPSMGILSGSNKTLPILTKPASVAAASNHPPLPPPVQEAVKHDLARPGSARGLLGRARPKSTSKAISPGTLVLRALAGGKGQLSATQELSVLLRGLAAASEPAREAYVLCLEQRLVARLLEPLSSGDAPPKDSPLLQATLSCLANLACIGGPAGLCDAVVIAVVARALRPDSSAGNQQTALACCANLSQDPKCVQLLRAAQAEPLLKYFASSPDTSLRAPACKTLRFFREVPDSTLQARGQGGSGRDLGAIWARSGRDLGTRPRHDPGAVQGGTREEPGRNQGCTWDAPGRN